MPLPEFRPAETFVDDLLASFEHQQAHRTEDLVSSLGLAAGFVGLALLGVTLRRALGSEHTRGAVLAVAFLVAGTIGAAAWVPSGLTAYARVVAVLAVLSVIWDRVAAPLLDTGETDIDFGLIGGLLTLLVAGVLVPVWAAWLARAAGSRPKNPNQPLSPAIESGSRLAVYSAPNALTREQ